MNSTLVQDMRLDAIYAQLPKINCQRKCQQSCGPIVMGRREWNRVIEDVGYEPKPTPDQAARLVCPMLDEKAGACSVYHVRPLICRLWGLVEAMACPWGCRPERWLTDAEAHHLMNQAERIG